MNAKRLERLERRAAGLRCRRCGEPFQRPAGPELRLGSLSDEQVRELERLMRPALEPCAACGRMRFVGERLTDEELDAIIAALPLDCLGPEFVGFMASVRAWGTSRPAPAAVPAG